METFPPDVKECMFPCVGPRPEPDPEELCAFTDLHGSLRVLLSFQIKDGRLVGPELQPLIENFLHTFSLANAGIRIHLKFKFNQQTIQQEFRVKIKSKVAHAAPPSLLLDITSCTHPPVCVRKGGWCQGGHPVLGARLPLSIPPDVMGRGLYGELSVQLVTLLNPCVKHPSNVPVSGPSAFFQNLPANLDYQEMGLQGLHCSSFTDLVHSGGIVYKIKQENDEEPQQESSLVPMQQNLLIFLLLQHSDSFISQLSDIMATDALIELHLEDILSNNRRAVTAALQTELKNTLKAQNHRNKDQEKLRSAADVILSSSIGIVSCSSNMNFRNACLNSMKVSDTHELSPSLRDSLRTVTSWKFAPKGRCYSSQMEEHPERDNEPTRTEI
ncbi:DUF4554 domain-containing protein isoform X3 [Scomber scombrus]|uniref:DUF4554 domain-containing protein isoform X3 n=1 Tax=Scomber scombrus TaxID=13677 RepID=A0AAV1PJ63_SCOSC